jgi:putative ABC transport system permease protein
MYLMSMRQTIRSLLRQPSFAIVAVLTLALGIGANTAVFSVLNSVILAPLPWDQPGQLVRLYTAYHKSPGDRSFLTGPDLNDVRDHTDAFAGFGAFYSYSETGGDIAPPGGQPYRVRVLAVGSGYFSALRATPLFGRTFTPDEERLDVTRIVLSHALWRQVANADPGIVGRSITFDGRAWEVIGVMRPGFRDLAGSDVAAWIPQDLVEGPRNSRNNHYLSAVARLAPGVTLARAQAEVDAVMRRRAEEFKDSNENRTMRVLPLLDDMVGESRASVYLLMGAATLVLLIACLNVANLFLVRSMARTRELAVRTALGAERSRLMALPLIESALVALVGGVIGSLVALWGVKLLLAVSPESLPRGEEVGFNPVLLAFALGTTMLTSLLFGAAPAWRAARVDPNAALHETSRGNTGGPLSRRIRELMVGGQVALAVILLTGAGALMKAVVALQHVELGFDPRQVETFVINLPPARYTDPATRVRFHEEFTRALRVVPGVRTVGATSWLPANGAYHQWGYDYRAADGSRPSTSAQYRVIEGDFFSAVGVPIVRGRTFNEADRADTSGSAVISQGLAKLAYGDRDPVGETFEGGDRTFRVIGVAGDVAEDPRGTRMRFVYLSHAQFADDRNWPLVYTVRATGDPADIVGPARAALAAIDPALVLFHPRPLDDVIAAHQSRERFTLLLMGTFAAVALALAAIGLFGVLSYAVTQRVHEIGIRMALGARPAQVRRTVLSHGGFIVAIGSVVGLVGALALGRVLESAVTGVRPRDPLLFASVLLVLAVAALAAGYLPARRATRIEPMEALRQ